MKKATNSALMRIKNEKIILSLINKVPVSRVDIAKKTGLTKAAVTIIIDDLKKRDIVYEKDGKSDSVGRRPVMLYLNGDAFYVVGVNITRRKIYVGIINLLGEVISAEDFSVESPDTDFYKIKKLIDRQIESCNIPREKIYKLSVVTPGPVDIENGMIVNPPNFKKWHNVPVVKNLKEITGFDVVFENVSSATAIAEKYFGSCKNCENFLALVVDDGIGAGIMTNDILFHGPCEMGHISVNIDGKECPCGSRGCLERYASIPEILNGTGYKTWHEIVDNAEDSIIREEAKFLSAAIVSANNIFRFEKAVLCGDIAYLPEKLTEYVCENLEKNTLLKTKFRVCAGNVDSYHLIAASLGVYDFFV